MGEGREETVCGDNGAVQGWLAALAENCGTRSATVSKARTLRAGPHRVIPKPLDGDAVPFGALDLYGAPPSLNHLFLNVKRGRIKSPEYTKWQVMSVLQLRRQAAWHVPGQVCVRLLFGRRDTRADLDNLIKPILDLLMAAGRIADDRNVVEIAAAFQTGVTGTRIEITSAAALSAKVAA